ncbi:cyclin binding protein [Cryptococcus neoformans Bt63]|nr:cyclin binding protein [Cryptococcus neoformans var. grubii Bt63]
MVKSNQPLQIRLTEPVIFLKGPSTGLDFRGRPQAVRQDGQPAMVRGLLTLRLNKPTRIRSITIKLEGKARTEWPEGIGAKRMETCEEHVILLEQATYFDAYRHDNSRSRSTRRALSLGPGVHVNHDDEQIDDDIDLAYVPRDEEPDDWINFGRRDSEEWGRNMVRSSSAMPGTHDSSSWHRDGFSRRPSFDNSARSSMLDLASLNLQDRGPSPAYTPTASPPRIHSALPGHISRPSSLRQSASPHLAPSRGPDLSPIASVSPSQNNSERGDSADTDHRRPARHMRNMLSSDAVREEINWKPEAPQNGPQTRYDDPIIDASQGEADLGNLPRSILAESQLNSSVTSPHPEVRFQMPETANEAEPQQSEEADEKNKGTTITEPALLTEEATSRMPPFTSAEAQNASSRPPVVGGNRAASIRTFNSNHSASTTSLSSSRENSTNENHPVNSAIQAISSVSTPAQTSPAPSGPPSMRGRSSFDSPEYSRPSSSRPPSIGSSGQRRASDQNLHSLDSHPSSENLRPDRARTTRADSTSTIVENEASRFGARSRTSSRARGHRSNASATPSLTASPNLAHLVPSSSSHEVIDDGRGRKSQKFSLAATLRGLSKDVKERVSHPRGHSKSRTRDKHLRANGMHDSLEGSSSSMLSLPMSRAGSSSALAPSETGRGSFAHGSRHSSVRNDDFVPPHGRGGAGSARRSRSRDRDSSTVRGRDQERSRSRARGRHMGMKVLTDKLGLGEHEEQEKGEDVHNWKEFRKGTYNYPISFPIPVNAPPTIHAEFGSVVYRLKATIVRVGALTSNLTEDMEVTMIATPQEDDLEETENVIVERQWEEQMRYQITLGGKAFPIAGTIPISVRLMPLLKCKIHRLTVALEEKTDYYAQERKVARHETPKRFILLFVKQPDLKERTEPLLPIISDDPNAAEQSPLAEMARQAAMNDPPSDAFDLERDPNDAMYASLMEPTGPWHLEKDLQLPDCSSKIKFTTKHDQTNITVAHWLKVTIRVERGDDEALDSKGRRKQFDIIIETPIKILDCRVNHQHNSLPTYSLTQRNFHSVPGICSIHTGKAIAPIGTARPIALPPNVEASMSTAIPSSMSSAIPGAGPHHHHLLPHRDHRNSESQATHSVTAPALGEGEDTLLERNIVYDRLMSGQLTETGEVPPTYGEAVADAVRERSVSRVRGTDHAPGIGRRGQSGVRGSRSHNRLRD